MKAYYRGDRIAIEIEISEAERLARWIGKMRDIEISIRGVNNPSPEGKVASELKKEIEKILRGLL